MKNKGFTAIEVLVTLLLVSVLAFGGWYVWNERRGNDEGSHSNKTQTEQKEAESVDTNDSRIISIPEAERPLLIRPDDTSSLPEETPDSFKNFLAGKLSNNDPNELNCIKIYKVSKISEVNVSGSSGSVDAEILKATNDCFGGAGTVWYQQDGVWHELGFQAALKCSEIAETTIYSEFIGQCLDKNMELSSNPNGSIKEAVKS